MNIFEAMFEGAWDSIKSPTKVLENTVKGDFSKAFSELKHMPGNQERANTDILNSFGIRGWVGDHPGETAAGVVASIFGGAAILGGGAAGAGATGGTAAGASTEASVGASSAMAYTPTASSVLAGSGGSTASALAYTPSASSVLSGTGATGIIEGAGTSALTYMPTQSTVLGGIGSGIPADFSVAGTSSGAFSNALTNLRFPQRKQEQSQSLRTSGGGSAPSIGGGKPNVQLVPETPNPGTEMGAFSSALNKQLFS